MRGGQLQRLARHAACEMRRWPAVQPAGCFSTRPEDQQPSTSKSWMPEWLSARVPAVLGGSKEALDAELTLDGAPLLGAPKELPFAHTRTNTYTTSIYRKLKVTQLALRNPAAFAGNLRRARRLGGLTGFVHGTGRAADPAAQGHLRMFEKIIG